MKPYLVVEPTHQIIRKNGEAFLIHAICIAYGYSMKLKENRIAEYWEKLPHPNFLEKYRWVVVKIDGRLRAFCHEDRCPDYWSYFCMIGDRLSFAPRPNLEVVSYF